MGSKKKRFPFVELSCLMTSLPCEAFDQPTSPSMPDMTLAVQTAVDRGLAALVKLQSKNGEFGHNSGVTALAGIALLAGGHTPTRGSYAHSSAMALRCTLAHHDDTSGYLGADNGRMYGHGFATLYLAECYGMAPSEPVRSALEAAVELIIRSQNSEGGWRYEPFPLEADISVTACQVMALRAAWNVGVGSRDLAEASERATTYISHCASGDGTFFYPGSGALTSAHGVPRVAAAALSLIQVGITDPGDVTLGPAMHFIRRHSTAQMDIDQHFWYGQYYASGALP